MKESSRDWFDLQSPVPTFPNGCSHKTVLDLPCGGRREVTASVAVKNTEHSYPRLAGVNGIVAERAACPWPEKHVVPKTVVAMADTGVATAMTWRQRMRTTGGQGKTASRATTANSLQVATASAVFFFCWTQSCPTLFLLILRMCFGGGSIERGRSERWIAIILV